MIAPEFVAFARSDADRRATVERIRTFQQRIDYLMTKGADAQAQIFAAERQRDGIPAHGRGWPLLTVALFASITILLEYVPANLFTQVFNGVDYTAWRMLTVTFTVIPAALAIAFGELLRRLRSAEEQRVIDWVMLILVAFATVAFLAIGYSLRIAFTTTAANASHDIQPWIEAVALTLVATVGIVLTLVSGYYREGAELFNLRWRLAWLRRLCRANEAYLGANQRDLARALASVEGELVLQPEPSVDAPLSTKPPWTNGP
jgi:hypothetical protein